MKLVPLHEKDFKALFDFEVENREWFESWVPPRPDGYYEYEVFTKLSSSLVDEMNDGDGLYFLGIQSGEIIGRFNLTFTDDTTADIGYRVSGSQLGKGYGYSFGKLLLAEAKKTGVTKCVAEALLENRGSTRILEKLGFQALDRQTTDVNLGGEKFTLAAYSLILTSDCDQQST